MSPEDVLLEAMAVAALKGNAPELRNKMCRKLNESILSHLNVYMAWSTQLASAKETRH